MAEYRRGRIWWISYSGPDGKTVFESTRQTSRDVARRLYRQRKREVADGTWVKGTNSAKGERLETYAARWTARQHERGLRTSRDIEQRCRDHVLPVLGDRVLADLRPRDVIAFVDGLKRRMRQGEMAPRTVHHIYDVLKWLCRDAQIDEVIIASPCVLPPGTLPAKKDRDPRWRATALFAREEVELLISDERVPEDRRVFYALEFLTGCRFGEAAGRRWRDYDAKAEPLGRLIVDSQYEGRELKSPRGDAPLRAVPVHPTLAAMLAEWKLHGFGTFYGRNPRSSGFIVPREDGHRCRSRSSMYKRLRQDCDRLEIPRRRQHDTRRTFITLARADGADREVLKAITHGARGDVFDLYTSWPWETLCSAVSRLRIQRRGQAATRRIRGSR